MAEYHEAMDKLQLLNGRVQIYQKREDDFQSVLLARDSSITDLKQSLNLEMKAGELCESDLDGTKKKLRQERTQKTIFAGTTIALIGAVLYLAISN